jgi:toxin ParE1/3/4
MKIVFRPAAIEDLDNFLLHIARDDPTAAIRVVDAIETFYLETLADNPLIGTAKDEIVQGLRIFPVSSYLICHFVNDNHIEIARIVHGSQNYQNLL